MKRVFGAISLLALAACDPAVPDSGSGVGFGNYDQYEAERARRDAALEGRPLPAAPRVESVTIINDETTAAAAAAGGVAPQTASTDQPLDVIATAEQALADPATPAGPPRSTAGISDEQNFDAVAGRESIESDAARIARAREQYQVIQPTALPSRSGNGPNIVEYALSTTNSVGQPVYRRSAFSTDAKFLRNCAQYASADQAQQDFLARGGPQRDRQGLDPDGDGFACAWDPAPYRLVRQ
ncbi:hypothetical protein [Shimia ponticola]|uniref:hypothetical protein n=1 Tax=Shimia ponticola TaxID=2582893 RepID=UPI0011BFDF0A|nr:hypothetical protein [Shimia ponticola]